MTRHDTAFRYKYQHDKAAMHLYQVFMALRWLVCSRPRELYSDVKRTVSSAKLGLGHNDRLP